VKSTESDQLPILSVHNFTKEQGIVVVDENNSFRFQVIPFSSDSTNTMRTHLVQLTNKLSNLMQHNKTIKYLLKDFYSQVKVNNLAGNMLDLSYNANSNTFDNYL